MIFGYARVSTREQNLDLQLDALKKAGCERVFKESISGSSLSRPEFEKLLELVRKDDVIVVWRIDRLGRRTLDLISLMVEFGEKGVHFVSLKEGIDTRTKMGQIYFLMTSIFAENEVSVIRERTNEGLESARARGRVGGKPKGLSAEAKETAKVLKILYDAKELSVEKICKRLKIGSKATFYKYLNFEKNRLESENREE